MPHLNWTIDAGQILLVGILLPSILTFGKFMLAMRDDMRWLMGMLKEFPPHLHPKGGNEIYPKGYAPDR